jgi:indole-3-glycerol phosphate synthase
MILRAAPGILSEIVQSKHAEVEHLVPRAGELEKSAASSLPFRRSFTDALLRREPAIIAEIKKASPSRGLLQPNFDPASLAKTYQKGGAACLSVLTDSRYFQGSPADLNRARQTTDLPVLRKDFTIHPVQIYEAAALGADAVLLIAAILTETELRNFRELAESLQLAALVEVHEENELARALDSGATLIGVNNRNLQTFEVTLDTSLRLGERIPSGKIRVSESGIFTRSHIDLLRGAGFQAFLIGESLMKASDPAAALQLLLN